MEAERLDLPDQVLQLAVSQARGARGGQRPLRGPPVVQQVRRGTKSLFRITHSGGADAVGNVDQELAVLLGWRALLELGEAGGFGGTDRCQAAAQATAWRA